MLVEGASDIIIVFQEFVSVVWDKNTLFETMTEIHETIPLRFNITLNDIHMKKKIYISTLQLVRGDVPNLCREHPFVLRGVWLLNQIFTFFFNDQNTGYLLNITLIFVATAERDSEHRSHTFTK